MRRKVQFQSATRDADQAIEIKFERNLSNGWSITRESDDKVVYLTIIIKTSHTIHLIDNWDFCKRPLHGRYLLLVSIVGTDLHCISISKAIGPPSESHISILATLYGRKLLSYTGTLAKCQYELL